jgi:DNA-binding CsgD family transcriptional regulator
VRGLPVIEAWVDVKGYESFYQVSNMGNVRSKDRTVACSRLVTKNLRGRPLKATTDSAGYCKVTLQDQGRNVVWKVHRLVAEHFIDKVEGKEVINHIDNDRTNNNVCNLEWCTPKENTYHMHSQGRNYSASGESNPACKLSEVQIEEIKTLKSQLSQSKIAAMFGISRQHVSKIHLGIRRNT